MSDAPVVAPVGFRICDVCGDLAAGDLCATCEELGDRYDALYHAERAAQLFSDVPRVESAQVDDGLGPMRGAAFALKWTAIATAVLVLFGLLLRGWA